MKYLRVSFNLTVASVAATIFSDIWVLHAHQGPVAEVASLVVLLVGPICVFLCPVMYAIFDKELPAEAPKRVMFALTNFLGTLAGLPGVFLWCWVFREFPS